MQVSDNKAASPLMHLVFLALDTPHSHLELKLLDENNNSIIQRHFTSSFLNKDDEYLRKRSK